MTLFLKYSSYNSNDGITIMIIMMIIITERKSLISVLTLLS